MYGAPLQDQQQSACLRACGMGPEEKRVSVTSWWECVTDQGEEAYELFKHRPWFSQGTLTYLTSVGRATQLDTSSQEYFWMVSEIVPSLR